MNTTDLTIADSGSWRLLTLISLPCGLLLLLVGVAVAVWVWRSDDDLDIKLMVGGGLGIAPALIGLALAVAAVWPLDTQYLQWRSVSGTADRVESRLLADGDGMSERYVVTIDGTAFGVDDTRASLLETGDFVELSCRREWQYAANDGYVCRWGGVQK